MILATTNETLNVDTVTAGTIDYEVYYADHTSTTFTANSTQGSISAITTTNVLSAPSAGTQRQVKTILLTNRDASTSGIAQTVFIKKVVSGTDYYLTPNTRLNPGESLLYTDKKGVEILNRNSVPKTYSYIMGPTGTLGGSIGCQSARNGARVIANSNIWTTYVGKAPRNGITQISFRYRVVSAGVAIIAAEWGLYVAPTKLVAQPVSGTMDLACLYCMGWTDFSANAATIGNYTATITVGGHVPLREGDDVWLGAYNMFTTTGVGLDTCSVDDLTSGLFGTNTAPERRPSVDIGYNVQIPNLTSLSIPIITWVYWG